AGNRYEHIPVRLTTPIHGRRHSRQALQAPASLARSREARNTLRQISEVDWITFITITGDAA
ncbi:MAG: hypothetical protein NWQ24_08890, partial [Haliea sp.]|nr:hypothetical protein [Haliea sp.]